MSERPLRVEVTCLGNICRSPMAHVVLEQRLADAGLADDVVVTSSGTGGWHEGEPMDERAATALSAAGYDPTRHRARTFTTDTYAEADLMLAMDARNHADMTELAPTVADAERVRMFRSFDPEAAPGDDEVEDPWYGGAEGFQQVLAMVERTSDAVVAAVPRLRADLTG
ncbi:MULTISPECIES: low molecular weight protein-tyrosine-phosphatase [unclassified Aeromicrobium]|jgi:protein-tyrosine phosphatase|uniref:low molecular weight protein-tyrosine-phosphatase n=1 Tax=unclassified Aeromicrobium TaxID=2633570 RepID=UPI0006F91559|nr:MULTISPECIES: low molecular weight protein-tyrosine-phosphatase [unclassified Aeromicrobium]KQO36538.1 protein tyrosine phosphatase [Aeromicrobium sp. Leaf245]KQP27990.1 protein tyrosine phosphatase [Aeromicrobium sp. Leaf272]KQP78251.1 protein tyrosine phosphatase [Aeromicrobium sp. Leaf289]KQP83962.1 protein tyrosine phosphatase [Aeromicrobium sp. Leaf291]